LLCHYPEDLRAEQYLQMVQDLVIATKAKRVVFDSISDIQRIYNERRFRTFIIGLNAFLKSHDVTSVFTNTAPQILGATEITETHLSTASDNIIILKYVELGGQMHRLISVLKERGSMHKKELMEFEITKKAGVEIIGPFEGVENLMSGFARRIRQMKKEAERDFIADAVAGKI
jgi:circadian clock protein KaiC